MVLDLERLDVDARFVLFLDGVDDVLDDEICHVIHMATTLGCGDGVDETHVLEALVRHTDGDFPPWEILFFADSFMGLT